MAFIKNKERKSLIAKINQSYAFRKVLISIEIAALIGFIVVIFVNAAGKLSSNGVLPFIHEEKLTMFGIGMLVYALLIALFGIIALILTFTIKSPKKVKEELNKLQSSAISGKKVKATDTNVQTNKDRTTIGGKNKKKK